MNILIAIGIVLTGGLLFVVVPTQLISDRTVAAVFGAIGGVLVGIAIRLVL